MSRNNIEQILYNIRKMTPNHPDLKMDKEKTYTQKQWQFKMKVAESKENLRKKSTRLDTREEEIITSLDDLDKLLNIETQKMYTKKWKRLSKEFKINSLMNYYNKPIEDILKIYDKIKDNEVEYDEKIGKIKNITNNIFKDAE
jgi:hypothetical protein